MTEGETEFADKVKRAVRSNFNQSPDIYTSFEDKHRFFYTLTRELARWMGLRTGSRILDVGCGNGISCQALRELLDATVHGIDLSEGMIEDARTRLSGDSRVHLQIGDGERLLETVGPIKFDAVMYNAAIFVFPDPRESFRQAKELLRPGGRIGFSFYPRVIGPDNPDLIGRAYETLGLPLPKFRTITSWDKACQALREAFGNIQTTTYEMPGTVTFLTDFFSIPAQSSSLFPKLPYEERAKQVKKLFETLKPLEGAMTIGWDMAKAEMRES